jgi:predicted dehydrogenase
VNVLVIGRGFGARVVAPAFAATEDCRVVDVVSARDDAAVRAAIARDDVDLVSVHSPPFLHTRDVRCAIAAGKAVLCDKPFALDAREAAELRGEAARAGVVNLVNFEFRWQPARRRLRALLDAGDIGTVEHVHWVHLSAGTRVPMRPYGWLFDAACGGGWIGAWASHAIDTLRWWFGEVDAVVDAVRHLDVPERVDSNGAPHRCTTEDGLDAWLRMENGVFVSIESSYARSAGWPPRITVSGSEGAIELVGDDRLTLVRHGGKRDERVDRHDVPVVDRHDVAMRIWARVVHDVCAGDPVPDIPTFADGAACDAVLDHLRAAPLL